MEEGDINKGNGRGIRENFWFRKRLDPGQTCKGIVSRHDAALLK